MKLSKIYEYLDSISPFELQESWDNSGLQIGSMDMDIDRVVLSLELDMDILNGYGENTLFVVHHPLIFGKLTSIDFAKYPSMLIQKIIQNNQAVIAMHTNFDKTHLNRYVMESILGWRIKTESDFILKAEIDMNKEELISHIKKSLGLDFVRVINPKEYINSVSLTTGSGASLMDFVNSDCFLTGDIKYHDAIKAQMEGLMMIDIGHWESEIHFANALMNKLKSLPISAIIAQSKNPFSTI